LSKTNAWLALLVVTGWLLTGFCHRLAFQGMENGLHGFIFACIVAFGMHYLRLPADVGSQFDRRAFYLKLGFLLALLALTRVDCAMLALLMGVAVLFGLVRPGQIAPWRMNWRGAFWLTLPGLFLFGGDLVGNWLYFGTALPLSGEVKFHLQRQNGWWLHGSPWGELKWHLRFLGDMAAWPLAANLEKALWAKWHIVWPMVRTRQILLVMAALGLGYGAHRDWRRRGRRPQLTSYGCFLGILIVFGAAHFAMIALSLPYYAGYATWYFSVEVMLFWCVCGLGIVRFSQMLSAVANLLLRHASGMRLLPSHWLVAAMCALMIVVSAVPICGYTARDSNFPAFFHAASWFNAHLPAGQKLSSFSSGVLAYFAAPHQVTNLDGLMNDRDYFQNYLKTNQIDRYVRARGIGYFADQASADAWRSGNYWGMDLGHMRLLEWWPMSGDFSFGIWKILPMDQHADVLDPCDGPHNRVSQIQYAAAVLNRFEIVEDDRLEAALKDASGAEKQLVTSILVPESQGLRHVFVPRNQVPSLGLTPNNCLYETAENVVFGDSVELVGIDLPNREFRRNQRIVISRYWTLAHRENRAADGDYTFELSLGPVGAPTATASAAPPRLLHSTHPCYGTFPVSQWRADEAVVETYSIPLPAELAPGAYALMLSVKDASGRPLAPSRNGDQRSACFLTNIQIRP
jgi:hypothetical protein